MAKTIEERRQAQREYYEKNRAKICARSNAHYHNNKESIALKTSERYQKNRDAILQQGKEYYRKNRDARQACNKAWFEKNRATHMEYIKKWKRDNRDKLNARLRERFSNDPLHNLKVSIRNRNAAVLRRGGYTKRSKTPAILGCQWEQFKEHIESRFIEGMNWDNRKLWHLDHIIPLASAKDETELLALCHYKNIQPLWAEENLKKSDKILP